MPELESNVMKTLADAIGSTAGARLAYGDPVERAGVTVVPVARVRFGFGGGQKPGEQREQAGGGGGAVVTPAGFLILRGDEVRFRPIRDPARMIGLVLAIGFVLRLAIRALR
jgi:uncharacterized spore protein YtfJ